jgi:hypothetical protein
MSTETDFIKYQPKITEVTIAKAASEWGLGNDIISLAGRGTGLGNVFVLLLATDAETHGPYLLNAICAHELCARLIAEGFGPLSKS